MSVKLPIKNGFILLFDSRDELVRIIDLKLTLFLCALDHTTAISDLYRHRPCVLRHEPPLLYFFLPFLFEEDLVAHIALQGFRQACPVLII